MAAKGNIVVGLLRIFDYLDAETVLSIYCAIICNVDTMWQGYVHGDSL